MQIADDTKSLLRAKGSPERWRSVRERIVQMAGMYPTAIKIDVDGTCAPFADDTAASRPTATAIWGMNNLLKVAFFAEIISGRDGAYFAEKLPQWGLFNMPAASLYGTQTLEWHGPHVEVRDSPAALEGQRRLMDVLPTVVTELESRGIRFGVDSQPGQVQTEMKVHMANFQFVRLSDYDKATLRAVLESPEIGTVLGVNGCRLNWHESGSVEIKSIEADKATVVKREHEEDSTRRFVFFCDDTGDIALAQFIREHDLGIVVGVYNPPDASGRPGTPREILGNADVVMVGSDVAQDLGIEGVPAGALAQDRTGAFMLELARGLELHPPFHLRSTSSPGHGFML